MCRTFCQDRHHGLTESCIYFAHTSGGGPSVAILWNPLSGQHSLLVDNQRDRAVEVHLTPEDARRVITAYARDEVRRAESAAASTGSLDLLGRGDDR